MGLAKKHLGESRRAEIARTLFTVTATDAHKGELYGLCPIHGESNPSFSYNYKGDLYHCFACGADGDLIRLWTEVKGLGQKEGFKAFCDAFEIPRDSPGKGIRERDAAPGGAGGEESTPLDRERVIAQMNQAWELFPPLPDPWVERLIKTRGWSREWIEILDLRMQTHRFTKKGTLQEIKKPDRIAIPVRDAMGDLINIRLYKPGASEYKIISFARSTGSSTLFPARPLIEKAPFVLLCEGESDTICALSHGFNAITQTSKLKRWPEAQRDLFKNRDVIIAYDADAAGVQYGVWASQALAGAAKSIRVIGWPAFMGAGEDGNVPEDHGPGLDGFLRNARKDCRGSAGAYRCDEAGRWTPAPSRRLRCAI